MAYNELRVFLISRMPRQKLIDFIKRNDSVYCLASFAWHKDEQLRELAISVDKNVHAERQKCKRTKKNTKTKNDITGLT